MIDTKTRKRILCDIIGDLSALTIVDIPGIFEILDSHFSTAIEEQWREEVSLTDYKRQYATTTCVACDQEFTTDNPCCCDDGCYDDNTHVDGYCRTCCAPHHLGQKFDGLNGILRVE
jgi:hypothetical protein